MSKVYVGDTGTLIELDTGVSLAGATITEIKVKKPDGTIVTWPATVSGTSLRYTTTDTSLDISGVWLLQAHVVLPSGEWSGETARMMVHSLFT